MKKSLFLAMAAVALLSGCSKDDGGITIDNGNGGADNNDSPVMIQLGSNLITSSTTQTRSSLTKWDNTEVGVLGLAKNTELTTIWDITSQNTTCALPNVKGTIAEAEGTTATKITFTDQYYYPLDNSINYSFYGYYPYIATDGGNTIAANNNIVTVTYNDFNGSQDILWGCVKATPKNGATDAGNSYDGFNARYFRKTDAKGTTPNIEFKHQLVRLQFKITQGEEDVTNLSVSSIKMINMPSVVSMIVADKATEANEGQITFTPGNAEYLLSTGDGTTPATSVAVANASSAAMGESIMLPAGTVDENGNLKAKIKLTLNGTDIPESEITITPPVAGSETTAFTAGYSYNVNLTIHGLKPIEVTATLAEWKNGGDSNIEIN